MDPMMRFPLTCILARWLRRIPRHLASILGLIGTLMTVSLAVAEGMPPLRKADFESVVVSFGISPRCPIDPVEIRADWIAILKDKQLRNSAKASETTWPEGKLYFGASCRQTNPNEWIYNLDARWAWLDGDAYPSVPLAAELGQGSEEAIRRVMRHLLIEGLRQYLNANLVDSQGNNEAG